MYSIHKLHIVTHVFTLRYKAAAWVVTFCDNRLTTLSVTLCDDAVACCALRYDTLQSVAAGHERW